uniref:Uncharacterized protein n=1 Tax=Anguilla anguilla TaxID=7936 RepID=A0A0E9TN14_ANGAN
MYNQTVGRTTTSTL